MICSREAGEIPLERAEMARLELVVELVHQRRAELPDHRRELVAPSDLRVLVDYAGDFIEHAQVAERLFDLPRALPLDAPRFLQR